MLIDRDLNFENHILSKLKTCNRIIGLIKRNFKNMDFQGFLLLHKSLIRSHLEYAQTVWSPLRSKLIEAVEKVQKRATKILPGLTQLSYTHRLQKLDLPTLVLQKSQRRYDLKGVPFLQPTSSYCNTRSHNKNLFSYRLICICENIALLSELCPNGILCQLTL